MSILDLPNGILRAICEDRRLCQRDLYSITRTCRRLFHISVSYLYRINFFSEDGSAITWAIKGNRMAVIQRALDSGLDAVRPHHIRLAIVHGPDDLFTMLWENKAEHGGVLDPNKYVTFAINRGETLFNTATYYGRYDANKTLLEAGKVYIKDRNQALWDAAHDGSQELVKLLLEHGANAMTLNYHRVPPLSIAAGHFSGYFSGRCSDRYGEGHQVMNNPDGFLETARLLLHHGVEIEHRDDQGRTALYNAVASGNCQMVELLASYGADPTVREPREGLTALHASALYVGRLDMTELFLRLGADAFAKDDKGQDALWMYRRAKEPAAIAKVLLESGAGIDANKYGDTPLHAAANYGSLELAELLVEHGADVNATDRRGETPFHAAVVCAASGSKYIKFLIESGADTTITGESGRSALLWAFEYAPADTIRVLLENVANIKEVMGWRESVLSKAVDRDRRSQEIIDLIIQSGGHKGFLAKFKGGRLHQGAITGDIALMHQLIHTGIAWAAQLL